MGLDMYLYKRGGVDDLGQKIKDEEIGYWRKFNALHSTILDIVGAASDSNCEELDLTKENIEELLDICKKVKAILDEGRAYYFADEDEDGKKPIYFRDKEEKENYDSWYRFDQETIDKVVELLRPQSGFFWGDTDIDSLYERKVQNSIPIFEKALELINAGEEIYYYCWW